MHSASTPWIQSRRWDLAWLIGSAVLVPAGLVLVWAGAPADAVNLGVTALVGGPHVFSTLLITYLDPRFRRSHRLALGGTALLVPVGVVTMTLLDFQALMSFFVFWASLHVLQQNAYLADVYRCRAGRPEPAASRMLDYGVLFLSFYPLASYKLVRGEFTLGSIQVLIPPFARAELTWWLAGAAFAAALGAWLAKTAWEARRGLMNVPKTLLIGITVTVAFLIPIAERGERLELAFQTVNAWHSLQYLAIVWIVLKIRRQRGLLESPFVARLAGPGRAVWAFYGLCLLFTAGLLAVVFALVRFDPLGLAREQYYYMTVLSALFVHYSLDSYLFFAAGRDKVRPDAIPLAAPAAV
ncbi:MAG: hypothetical protein ACK44W_04830 [Planctomycetota bacterium]